MKFTLITTIIFAGILSIFLFVPFLAQAFENTFGQVGHTASVGQQFLRLGVLTSVYFLLVYGSIKARELGYENIN